MKTFDRVVRYKKVCKIHVLAIEKFLEYAPSDLVCCTLTEDNEGTRNMIGIRRASSDDIRKAKARVRAKSIKEAYDSVGMVKVRGSLGGVYYE